MDAEKFFRSSEDEQVAANEGVAARHVDIVVTELGELDYGRGVAPVAAEGVVPNAPSELLGK
jgi:hypothetical protein